MIAAAVVTAAVCAELKAPIRAEGYLGSDRRPDHRPFVVLLNPPLEQLHVTPQRQGRDAVTSHSFDFALPLRNMPTT